MSLGTLDKRWDKSFSGTLTYIPSSHIPRRGKRVGPLWTLLIFVGFSLLWVCERDSSIAKRRTPRAASAPFFLGRPEIAFTQNHTLVEVGRDLRSTSVSLRGVWVDRLRSPNLLL